MYSPNIQRYPVNNNGQSYFMPNQFTTLSNLNSPRNSQNSNRSLRNVNPQTNSQFSTPKGDTLPPYSQLRTALSLNLPENFPENRQNGIALSSRPSLEMSSFRKPTNSKDTLSPPRPIKSSEQLFPQTNDIFIKNANNKTDPLQFKQNQKNQNLSSMKIVLLPQQYQRKIKNMQNQLKFQQKYANDLYKEAEKYRNQITSFKDQITKLNKHTNSLQGQNNRCKEEINKINQQSEGIHQINKDYQIQITKLKQDNSQLTERGDKFEAQNKRFIDQINSITQHSNVLQKSNEQYRAKIKQSEDQNVKLTKRGEQFQAQNNRLIDQMNKITKNSNELKTANQQYKAKIKQSEDQNLKLTKRCEEYQIQNSLFIAEINRITKYSDELKIVNEQYKLKIKQSQDQIMKLTKESEHFQTQNNHLINEINKMNQHFDELKIAHERYKSKIKQLQDHKLELSERGDHFQSQNDRFFEQINSVRQEINDKDKRILHLGDIIADKDLRISKLQAYSRSQNVIISDLNSKIQNFNEYYNSAIYDERIKVLNQELAKLQKKLNQNVREKDRLAEDLKLKNQKILSMMSKPNYNDNRAKSQPRDTNSNDMANKMINKSFDEAIKQYQTAIDQLRTLNQQKTEENCKLCEEIIQYKQEIDALNEEKRILSLKHSSSSRRILGGPNTKDNSQNRVNQLQDELNDVSQKLKMIETRYMSALKEINKKDEFLKEHLLARTQEAEQKRYIESVMKKYINTFDSRFALIEQVQLLEQEIKKYEAAV